MKLTVALAQVTSGPDSTENLRLATKYVADAKAASAQLIVFPEVFMNHYPANTPLDQMESQTVSGPFVTAMRDLAQTHQMWCVFGMRQTGTTPGGRTFNTTVVLTDAGDIAGIYRKTHLYDAFGAKESERVEPGRQLFDPIASPWGRIGLFVCYELRFPEVARDQVAKGAEILIVPSGWVRGPLKEDHWEHLVVTRALENTVFVLACDQVSDYYCGQSVVVDPMGVKLAQAGEEPSLVVTTIDTDRIDAVRKKLPSLGHRRPELYETAMQHA